METTGTISEHKIDVDEITACMEKELDNLHPLSKKYSIYRVPRRLRQLNEKAYTPLIVSIGPFHHGKEELKEMEEDKRRCLKKFLDSGKVKLKDCVNLIKEKEKSLRDCYAEVIELSSKDFVKMVILDAAFLITVLCIESELIMETPEPIFSRPWKILDITYDIVLLENQLPFFIMEELFMLSKIHENDRGFSMVHITHEFIKVRWPTWVTQDDLNIQRFSKADHIVDFLRIYHEPASPNTSGVNKFTAAPSVTKLHQAGVKFRLASSTSLLDIKFSGNILQIPSLEIGTRAILFRNVQAFEQLHCDQNYINDYICIMSDLVSTPEDVQLLAEERILVDSGVDTEALFIFFRDPKRQTTFYDKDFYFSGLTAQLNDYHTNQWHKWKATLKQEYFNTPWSIISVIAAVILLLLTLIQSVCSVLEARSK